MANLTELQKKFPEVEKEKLLGLISDASLKNVPARDLEAYIAQQINSETPTEIKVEDNTSDEDVTAQKQPSMFKTNRPEAKPKAPVQPEKDGNDIADEVSDDTNNEDEESEEGTEEGTEKDAHPYGAEIYDNKPAPQLPIQSPAPSGPVNFKQDVMTFKPAQRNAHSDEPDVPFNNPDLTTIDVPDGNQEESDETEEAEPEPEPEPKPKRPDYYHDEMIRKTITPEMQDTILRPFRPFLEDIRKDSGTLNKLAAQIDGRYMPPYMQIKGYIINHPIKDPNNTTVLLSIISESNARRTEQRYINLTQAQDVTRALAEQIHIQASLNNYDAIVEKLMEDRRTLVNLVFILENYCEQKQVSPFELSIPKRALMESVEQSFNAIKGLIITQVVAQLSTLRKDFQGEMGDVRQRVEKSMTLNNAQLQEAVTKVLWKVKTDVEDTNREEMVQALLWSLNKKEITEKLGGAATAVIGIMIDDFLRRLIASEFKLEKVTEQRRYTLTELSKRLGYKGQSNVMVAIQTLLDRNLIKIYENRLYSL